MSINIDHLRHAARIADEAVKSGPQPTTVIAVANRDATVWTHVAPGADGVTLGSIFQIASVTKPLIATAVMRLVEEGKLALNLPVAAYLPDFAANGKERVTAWQLLTHSSGMLDESFWHDLRAFAASGQQPSPGYLIDACCRRTLSYEPGTAYKYNSLAFSTLADLVTRLGGEPYPAYLLRHIFEPLGMASTAFSPVDRKRAAPLHDFGPPQLLDGFNALAIPGGGLWSTAADLVAFGQAYLRGGTSASGYKLLSSPAVRLMTQDYTHSLRPFDSSDRVSYGLGWRKPASPRNGDYLASERAFGHKGASGTMLWIDPEYDLVYVFLSNRWDIVDPFLTRERCLNAVYGGAEYAKT